MNNDRAAQKLLYHQHKDRLMSIIYRYTRQIDISKDLLQETFIKIFKKLSDFNEEKGSFNNWTARIAINETLQYKRSKNIFSNTVDLTEKMKTIDDSVLNTLTIEELRSTIDRLPEVHQVILNLFYFDEYSHSEIGDLLNIEPSSSRSRLTRARKILAFQWFNLNASKVV